MSGVRLGNGVTARAKLARRTGWQKGKPQVLWPGDVDPGAVVEALVMLAE